MQVFYLLVLSKSKVRQKSDTQTSFENLDTLMWII